MKILKQLLIILTFSVAGALISYLFSLMNFSFPGSLIGMILMFVFMLIGLIKTHHVQEVGQFFIDNMGIFFVPASIAILKELEILSLYWWKLIVIIFAAFIVSFTATYWSVRLTLYLQYKARAKKEEAPSE